MGKIICWRDGSLKGKINNFFIFYRHKKIYLNKFYRFLPRLKFNSWHSKYFSKKIRFALTSIVLIFSILFSTFSPQGTRAANYFKPWSSTSDFNSGTNSNIDTSNDETKLASTTTNFTEDFSGTTYKDAATNANWDTGTNKLALPGDPINGTPADLQAKWKEAVGLTEAIKSSVYDSTNHFIYLGGSSGSFAAYNTLTQTTVSLTSKISAATDWSTNAVNSLVFDSATNRVYMGGASGKFGVFTSAVDPSNGIWVNLTSKIATDWSINSVNSLVFDSATNRIYMGGFSGKFGVFTSAADPLANGVWVNLTPKISGATDWSTNAVNSIIFDSASNRIYMGGASGKFGAFTSAADPLTNGAFVNLVSKISTVWSNNAVSSLAFDSATNRIYMGGTLGKFGVFTSAADPLTNGAFVSLVTKISNANDFSTNSVNSLAFDSATNRVYMGGTSGKFGVFTSAADPLTNGAFVNLVSKISNEWSTNPVNAMFFDSDNNKVYFVGDAGRFGVFTSAADPLTNGAWNYLFSNTCMAFVGFTIRASTIDTTNNILYLGGDSSRFAAYKISDGSMINLTAKISAVFSANAVTAMTFDPIHNKIYLGGGGGKFGDFTVGTDPANGSWSNLTPKISNEWSTNTVSSMVFDSANRKIYLGGGGGKFGFFDSDASPDWVNLTSKIEGDWQTNGVNAMVFDSIQNKIYLGGTGWSRFGAFEGGADPLINGQWSYFYNEIYDDWLSSQILSLAFDSTSGKIYLGGGNGRFGVHDPAATVKWTYLNEHMPAAWSSGTIYTMSFFGNKIFMGGDGGRFGVYDPVAPSNKFSSIPDKISSFWSTNAIRTMVVSTSSANIFLGGDGGKLASYLVGYLSDKDGISLAVDNTARSITRATLTATENKPANTGITYYLSNNGGSSWHAVTLGAPFSFEVIGSDLRWKANLTGNAAVTPEISNLAVSYSYYNSDTGSLNLSFNAEQSVAWTGLSWNSSLPANTTLAFKVRSAADQGGLSSATWSEIMQANSTPVDLRTIDVGEVTGAPDGQWAEVQIDFATSNSLVTPTLYDATLSYVINTAPEIESLSVSSPTNGSKIISVSYNLRDSDTDINPFNPGQSAISLQYSLNSGGSWQNCITTTGTGLVSVSDTFASKTASWNVGADLPNNFYENIAKIKVIANDNELAHNSTELASGTFSLDTKNPAPVAISDGFTGIKVNDGNSWTNNAQVDLTLSASDDSSLEMQVRNDQDFTADGYEPYSIAKADYLLSAGDGEKNVYVRFRDQFGNTSDSQTTVLLDTTPPDVPGNVRIYDTSDRSLLRYSLTLIWDSVPQVSDFDQYVIERSIDGSAYGQLTLTPFTTFTDSNVDNTRNYSYRIKTKDIHNNLSSSSLFVTLRPTAQDVSAPVITGDAPTVTPEDIIATVAWTTDEPSDSYVEYGLTDQYGSIQGKDGLVANHSIVLVGLKETTIYHYRVRSKDGSNNQAIGTDHTFTTTLGKEAEGDVSITGATAQKPGADPEEVTIIWTTDRYSSSQVIYGISELNLDQQTEVDPTLNKTHYVTILKLKPNTKYYYKAKSVDAYGNEVLGELKYFVTTDSSQELPVISEIEAFNITLDSAIVSWNTTVVSTSIVEYGIDTNYGQLVEDQSTGATTKHIILLKNLNSGTKYHYRISGKSADDRLVAANVDSVFTTQTLPKIEGISTSEISSDKATVKWKTNIETDSFVDFGIEALDQSQGKSENGLEHTITLIGLKPATEYKIKAKSRDKYGNLSESGVLIFKTIVDSIPPVIKDLKSETSTITDANGNSKAQAIISWSTDEQASSQIRYSKGVVVGDEYPLSTSEDQNLTTSHVVIISNLEPSATYHMKVISKDSAANLAASDDYTVLMQKQDTSLVQYIIQILEERFSWLKQFGIF